jgi:hypothetical protein
MPQHLQAAKAVVLAYFQAMRAEPADAVRDILLRHVTDDYGWRGVHPFNELRGAEEVARVFLEPLLRAFSPIQRRTDVFLAGENAAQQDGSVWVLSMGHLLGRFDQPWLGIAPTRKIVMLRFAEFHRVEGGKIAETAMFCDILHVMQQAGLDPLGPQTAAPLVQPGPSSHDGLLYGEQPSEEGQETLALIRRMMTDLGTPGKFARRQDELRRHWAEDMLWWGPGGIGATYTIDRYVEQHAGPFRAQLQDRSFHGHVAFIAEGGYGGFFGWPNLSMRNAGGFLGLPPPDERSEMRVTDVYRRVGDRLAENWVFIDMLHFLKGQGLDLLARTTRSTQST